MLRATRSRLAPLSLVTVNSLHTVGLASAVTVTGSVDSAAAAPAAAETGPAGATLNMVAHPVSVTAGDKGRADGYWQSREKGVAASSAQIAQIAQVENAWPKTDAKVPGHPIVWFSIEAVKDATVRIGLAEIEAWPPG